MTNSIQDIAQSQCILAIGTNTSSNHPVIGTQVRRAVMAGAKLIVVDPFKIPLARYADLYLQPRPGTNIPLLLGMARVIVDEKLHDQGFIRERCEDFETFRASLEPYNLDYVAEITGIQPEQIFQAACLYATRKPAAILYGMGIAHFANGTENVMTVGNLAMLTGSVGKPGSGVNPLRGQNNVQGVCDMGGLPNVFPGYQPVTDAAVREKFEKAWKVSNLSGDVGLTIPQMYDAIDRGEIKALYIVGENPALTEPDLEKVRRGLDKVELLVMHDIFRTESTIYADVVFPAAAAMEGEGTFSNTERRVQWLNQVVPPPGDARPNWWIVGEVAKRMGASGFDYTSARDVLREINQLTPSFAGLTAERLQQGGLQWPCPDANHPGTPVLHKDRFTIGKGRFIVTQYRPPAELPDADYPYHLSTIRRLFHYHTRTMTGRVPGLNQLMDRNWMDIHPADAEQLGLALGDRVRVTSRRGSIEAFARVTENCRQGMVFMDFHFADSPVNFLVNPVHDPICHVPEFKAAAVKIEKVG
jgi:predicted molibdopterin-dependent oxidoreductase YjgC